MKLENIEKLIAKATPGKWSIDGDLVLTDSDDIGLVCDLFSTGGYSLPNAEFIVAAHELMPKLLRVVKEAKTLIPDSYQATNFFDALEELEK